MIAEPLIHQCGTADTHIRYQLQSPVTLFQPVDCCAGDAVAGRSNVAAIDAGSVEGCQKPGVQCPARFKLEVGQQVSQQSAGNLTAADHDVVTPLFSI